MARMVRVFLIYNSRNSNSCLFVFYLRRCHSAVQTFKLFQWGWMIIFKDDYRDSDRNNLIWIQTTVMVTKSWCVTQKLQSLLSLQCLVQVHILFFMLHIMFCTRDYLLSWFFGTTKICCVYQNQLKILILNSNCNIQQWYHSCQNCSYWHCPTYSQSHSHSHTRSTKH